jgi:muramoyltetrapeptide carboxypeptidase
MTARPWRRLREGDCVGVVAPAGPAAPDAVAAVEPLFARFGLRARLYPSCHARHPRHDFLAGDDTLRTADLQAAFADPAVQAVCCLRGGHGSLRLLDRIDTASMRANAHKPFIGYSDITALHALRVREGLFGLHAPMPASDLRHEGAEDDAQALFEWLTQAARRGTVLAPGLHVAAWRVPGRASGRLVGGNLSLVAALLGTRWAWPVEGAILFLEDVCEAPYRIDRLLTQLRLAGVLDAAVGFVLGSFTEGDDPTAVLQEHLARLGKPLLAGWRAGHGRPNRPLPLGLRVALDAAAGTLTLEEDLIA